MNTSAFIGRLLVEVDQPDKVYRYTSFFDGNETVISLSTYNVKKKTPKGVWIEVSQFDKPKFINQTCKSQWAWSTEIQAREAFFYRKKKEAEIYIEKATSLLPLMEYIKYSFEFPTDEELNETGKITHHVLESHTVGRYKLSNKENIKDSHFRQLSLETIGNYVKRLKYSKESQ